MKLNSLKAFASKIRQDLIAQITSRLEMAMAPNSDFSRSNRLGFAQLSQAIREKSRDRVVEQVAYYWFNRLCALRFMDLKGYLPSKVLSPVEGSIEPEILYEARNGIINEDLLKSSAARSHVQDILAERITTQDPALAAYRILLNGACNALSTSMPFLFQKANDYTEYLLPADLLSSQSVIAQMCANVGVEECRSVEILGWLYQYYIADKKDQIFADLKNNVKISSENIGPATQLFTPEWIVRYLVENSLGRLWMLNHPESNLADSMEYYIAPTKTEQDFIHISTPEELKICDPCCGSGHMLVYAFDLLTQIYREAYYSDEEIPTLILKNNLCGLEIDERAGELAAFALLMKARELDPNFMQHIVQPKICVLEAITFSETELDDSRKLFGDELMTENFVNELEQFEHATNYGSLIRPQFKDPAQFNALIQKQQFVNDLMLPELAEKYSKIFEMSDCLAQKYHVVVTNPPYMGSKGMNASLGDFLKESYPDSKTDLCTAFMERAFTLALEHGMISMINMQSWMFLSSFEKLRHKLLEAKTILNMAHLGPKAFDSIGGEVVNTTAFVLKNSFDKNWRGAYFRLINASSEEDKRNLFLKHKEQPYLSGTDSFTKIPGSPIAYWLSERFIKIFEDLPQLDFSYKPANGMTTANNNRFLRQWYEVPLVNIGFDMQNATEAQNSACRWFPYNKGGEYRRWYGNQDYVVNWEHDGYEIKNFKDEKGKQLSVVRNPKYYFLPAVTWSFISSAFFGTRYFPKGFIFDVTSGSIYPEIKDINIILGLLASSATSCFLGVLNPTIHFLVGDVQRIPLPTWTETEHKHISDVVAELIAIAKQDWDSQEISWNFKRNEIVATFDGLSTLKATVEKLQELYRERIAKTKSLEEQNNENFIRLYGLEGELTPEHPLSQVTLCCNPYYYFAKASEKTEDELWAMQRCELMKDLISYAVGCMFGRYSLTKEGVILGRKIGESIEDYQKIVGEGNSYLPDDDNIIPVLDDDYFSDDITLRFKEFLKQAFGREHYAENLNYVEECLNLKHKNGYSIRNYFTTDFYNDHVKRYKKRPIYWMFQSPDKNFRALIYMHRYKGGQVSRIRKNYLLAFRNKLEMILSQLEKEVVSTTQEQQGSTTKGKKPKRNGSVVREIEKLRKIETDLQNYDKDCFYQLAQDDPAIDLNDGVLVNYPKFGSALKKISGLDKKED